MSPAAPLIKATNISQNFKVADDIVNIVKQTNFAIDQNSMTIIYGPSGSGKSTVLNILSGVQKPSTGNILFDGEDIYNYTADDLAYFRANQIGIVYQQSYWVSSLNILENIAVPLSFMGYSRSKAAKLAMEALQRVDMAPYAKKDPQLMSGGEQQRASMARALVNNPKVIIADEPTGNLDSHNGDMIMALLQNYMSDPKHSVIFVTHNIEYLALGDSLMYIHDGETQLMENNDIANSTEKLIEEMRARAKRLSEGKKTRKTV